MDVSVLFPLEWMWVSCFRPLLNAGVLDRTEDGRIVFPFEAVKVEFLLQAA